MNKRIPNEVAEYFKNGSKKLKKVWTKEPYVLFAEYEDGIIKSSDLTDELTGVMEVLKNYDLSWRMKHCYGRNSRSVFP